MELRQRRHVWRLPDFGLGRDNSLLVWANALHGAGFSMQLVIWSLFIESLGASPTQIGLVLGGSATARTLLALPAGGLVDRLSARPVIVVTMLAAVPGALIMAAAGAWWQVLIGAVIIDLGAVGIPATSAYIAAITPPEQRAHAYTYIYTIAFAGGAIVAPAAGGWIAELIGYRPVFLVSAVLLTLAGLLATRLERVPPPPARAMDAARVSYRDLLRLPGVLLVADLHLAMPLVLSIGVALLPNFLVDERGLQLGTIGTLASLGAVAGLGISVTVAQWRRLPGPLAVMSMCVALVAGAFALWLASGLLLVIAVAYGLRGAFGAAWPMLSAAMADVAPERLRGRGYGLAELGAGIGDISAPLAAGVLYGVNHRLPLIVSLGAALPLALGALLAHQFRARLVPAEMRGVPMAMTDAAPTH